MHYGRMRSGAPGQDGWLPAARHAALAELLALVVDREFCGPSVSCARDIDVTMTSQLLMLMMLTTLTSCQDEYLYTVDNFG